MSESILSLTGEREMLDDFVQMLHKCVETEYTSMEIFGGENTLVFLQLMTNINSNCLFSGETVKQVVRNYETNEDFRRIWGSIGANVESFMKLKYGESNLKVFVEAFLSSQEISLPAAQRASYTPSDLVAHRVNSRQTLSADFHHAADFWYVCFAMYRSTVQLSPYFLTLVKNTLLMAERMKDLTSRRTRSENKSPETIRVGQTTPTAA